MEKIFVILFLIILLNGCTSKNFVGFIQEKEPSINLMEECRFCITLEGEGTCRVIDISKTGDLDMYVGKKVVIYGEEYKGAVLLKCPVSIVAERIVFSE